MKITPSGQNYSAGGDTAFRTKPTARVAGWL